MMLIENKERYIKMTNKTKRIKYISLFLSLISTLVISLLIIFIPYPAKAIEHKFVKVDKNSLEFFVENNSLNETFAKIENKKYDEINLTDKKKVQNIVDDFSKGKHNIVLLEENDTQVSLEEFLKANKSTHNHYLSSKDKQLEYLTAFYKVVIDEDITYTKYIDKRLNEKTIEDIRQNKEKTELIIEFAVYSSVLFGLLFILFRTCLDDECVYKYIESLSDKNLFGI